MSVHEKEVQFQASNSYSTLNTLSNKTKNVWLVCHGIDYLSRYFIRYFSELDEEENYIIAPQAPSKYYQKGEFKHVGASWLTKENTKKETENVLRYLDSVYEAENIPNHLKLFVLGYSQGVSIALRWVASRKIQCDKLIICSGSIPHELTPGDFDFLKNNNTQVHSMVGNKDFWLTEERLKLETEKGTALFGANISFNLFEGSHEIKPTLIKALL